ncbi:MAG TPA: alpha/beta hydrolase fold domain-containing protein [Kofleriaceae bacterium]|nr:alpha/beta hydrolase fold domain-containing protein [Kofleriaceae bacterium]
MTSRSDPSAASSSPLPASPRKLRILCLHGYHGSADVLRQQVAALAAELASIAELVYVDAPSIAAGGYGWWHAVDDERAPPSDDPGVGGPRRHYQGWARTRDALAARFASDGPFDGVLGFSQGAALAGLLVGLRAPDGRPTPERPLVFGFAILFSGFSSNDQELAQLYARRDSYALPSLHVLGRADGIVAPAISRALAERFEAPVLVEHDGGHVVVGGPRVRAFVEAQRAGAALATPAASARAPLDVPLWRGRPAPAMRVVFPARPLAAPAAALVVFRGGAYAINHGSGGDAADWAAAHGMVGVEVPYRCAETGDAHPASYADAARAVRLVRDHAAAWGIDPVRVGVLGFSAGGHLASMLSTQPRLHLEPDDDLAARVSARPDFVILGYPVISFIEGYSPGAFVSSAENFFGRRELDEALRRQFSSELHVAADHPPVFVWTTADDALVPASHARIFAEACQRAGVPATLRIYPHGPHGMGLALDRPGDVGGWTAEALAWLDERGLRR